MRGENRGRVKRRQEGGGEEEMRGRDRKERGKREGKRRQETRRGERKEGRGRGIRVMHLVSLSMPVDLLWCLCARHGQSHKGSHSAVIDMANVL